MGMFRYAFARMRRWWAHRSTAQLAAALLVSQRNGLAAERQVSRLNERLNTRVRMDVLRLKQLEDMRAQVTHWIERTEKAEAVAKQARVDFGHEIAKTEYLEAELKDTLRSRDELIAIADNLRSELALPRTGVTTTAAPRRGRR